MKPAVGKRVNKDIAVVFFQRETKHKEREEREIGTEEREALWINRLAMPPQGESRENALEDGPGADFKPNKKRASIKVIIREGEKEKNKLQRNNRERHGATTRPAHEEKESCQEQGSNIPEAKQVQ